ncbi:MAG: hypothetical protein H0U69_05560 [Trueperaceae bacterium]|nr:hypothetical protein [Trueperaceae bacterium]
MLHDRLHDPCRRGHDGIGNHNHFGDGSFTARVGSTSERLVVGDRGRYVNGVSLTGPNSLGTGSQVIGPIRVQGCILGAGEDHTYPHPDERGAVLKGAGLARDVSLRRGEVVAVQGDFGAALVQRQSSFHPRR